jgi:hypothetical protein
MDQKLLVHHRLKNKITSFSVGKEELHSLFLILQERSNAAGELEILNYKKMQQTEEEYEKNKETISAGFNLNLTVTSVDGKELFGNVEDVFKSPAFPEQIKSIYVNSEVALKTNYNYSPRNSFRLFLDFTKPDLFNLSFTPSQATPNESNIEVQGQDTTWVHGVYSEFNDFVKRHPSTMTWLHKHSVYDLILWVFGFPIAFWVTYRFSGKVDDIFNSVSKFIFMFIYFLFFCFF